MTCPKADGNWTAPYLSTTLGPCNLQGTLTYYHSSLMMVTFDYDHSGSMDHILAYNRATGQVWIMQKKGHVPVAPKPKAVIQAKQPPGELFKFVADALD